MLVPLITVDSLKFPWLLKANNQLNRSAIQVPQDQPRRSVRLNVKRGHFTKIEITLSQLMRLTDELASDQHIRFRCLSLGGGSATSPKEQQEKPKN